MDALGETTRVREELTGELARVRAEADAAIAQARDELAAGQAQHAADLAERDAAVDRAHTAAHTARLKSAAAVAAKTAADDTWPGNGRPVRSCAPSSTPVRQQFDAARQHMQEKLDAAEDARQQAHEDLAAVAWRGAIAGRPETGCGTRRQPGGLGPPVETGIFCME